MRLDDAQRRAFCLVLHRALVEIRMITFNGDCQRAYDLADAVHNIPAYLDSPDFDLPLAVRSLRQFQSKYPRSEGDLYFNYLGLLVEAGFPL